MYSTDEIFARLQNGESSNVIANEMAKALNDAIAKCEEEQQKAQVQKKKEEAANRCAKVLNEFVHEFYPEVGNVEFKGADVDKIINSSVNMIHAFDKLVDLKSDEDVDKVLSKFLRDMKL